MRGELLANQTLRAASAANGDARTGRSATVPLQVSQEYAVILEARKPRTRAGRRR